MVLPSLPGLALTSSAALKPRPLGILRLARARPPTPVSAPPVPKPTLAPCRFRPAPRTSMNDYLHLLQKPSRLGINLYTTPSRQRQLTSREGNRPRGADGDTAGEDASTDGGKTNALTTRVPHSSIRVN
ncbi:hypothetical protein MKEN_00489100 [Mycena kentingensis (nom. inval.)]|nr:hypothetical protein MKEN_00489100 [Mycena kentingensis (nom. inval.)]